MEYIRSLSSDDAGCFLCEYAANPAADATNLVLWRTSASIVVFNRFPYTNGHLLIAPRAHKPALSDLTTEEVLDSQRHIRVWIEGLKAVMRAQGFNVGMNIGPCAGAGLPDHLHWHIVPRWSGDTNYMSIIADVRVIPDALERNYAALRAWAADSGIAAELARPAAPPSEG